MTVRANERERIDTSRPVAIRLELSSFLATLDPERALGVLDIGRAAVDGPDTDGEARSSFISRRAVLLIEQGRRDEAVKELLDRVKSIGRESEYAVNLLVNAAAIEAENGHPDSALDLLSRATGTLPTSNSSGHHIRHRLDTLPSGKVQFDWIRACAYHQKGELAQAELLAKKFYSSYPAPTVKLRAAICLQDADGVAAVMITTMEKAPSNIALYLQPAVLARMRPPVAALFKNARTRSEVDALYQSTQRDLPPEYASALGVVARQLQ